MHYRTDYVWSGASCGKIITIKVLEVASQKKIEKQSKWECTINHMRKDYEDFCNYTMLLE